ncbi:MAG: KpsF/GutQ family sugar-phosphate isomerase [Bacteroidetes bacterium]|jgi:arabinose-5-phosphate isomerase|nr:KpsF/GutQ family sugar-phosphate isomerase [Bacteroidota bacterium]
MSNSQDHGKRVVRIEAAAVAALEPRIGAEFVRAVDLLAGAVGRVVVTGMGKSGIIARKIVATMNSTGTPAIFLHPGDAVHGDLGTVQKNDVVICISKSGDSDEIRHLLPVFRKLGVPVIALIGNLRSELAQKSDIVLDASVVEEACPHDLAPTASTTAALVMGDALAVALLQRRHFTKEDFAMFHPGGNLGKQLLLEVDQLMVSGDALPVVREEVSLSDAIVEMTSKRLGATCVVDAGGALTGIITDGDLRRLLQRTTTVGQMRAMDVMSRNPKTVQRTILAATALEQMEHYKITQLIVTNDEHHPVGMVHLHDLVKAGIGPGQTTS